MVYSKEAQVGKVKPTKTAVKESAKTPENGTVACPKCKRTFIYFRIKANEFVCRTCGEVWSKK